MELEFLEEFGLKIELLISINRKNGNFTLFCYTLTMQISSAKTKIQRKLEDLIALEIQFPPFLPYKAGKLFGL